MFYTLFFYYNRLISDIIFFKINIIVRYRNIRIIIFIFGLYLPTDPLTHNTLIYRLAISIIPHCSLMLSLMSLSYPTLLLRRGSGLSQANFANT